MAALAVVAALVAGPGAGTARGGTNYWSGGGPEGRQVAVLAADPTTPETLYAGTDDGLYRSMDGGARWSRTNLQEAFQPFAALVAIAGPPPVLYAAGGFGVRRSGDGGESWRSADDGISSRYLRALAIDPGDPRTLYAGTYRASGTIPSGVFKTSDGGARWHVTGLSNSSDVAAIAVDPADTDIVYAIDRLALVRSPDGGATWSPIDRFRFETAGPVIAVGDAQGSTVYAGIGETIYRSTDRGTTWQGGGKGLLGPAVVIAADPTRSTTVYAGTRGDVFKSTNGGATWASLGPGPTAAGVVDLALDPHDRRRLYAATSDGVFSLTQDGFFACTGDCSGDDLVTIDELVRGVRVALGDAPPASCPALGTPVSIDQLLDAVRGALEGCLPLSQVRDFSTFRRFALSRHPGYGFCPPLGVYSATIERQPDGAYALEHQVLEEGVVGVDECVPNFVGEIACATVRSRPSRLLDSDEVGRVLATFSRVLVHAEAERICRDVIFDPCLVDVLTWDDFQGVDFICGAPRIDARAVDAILDLLAGLA